jgi:hypothetical protein
MGLEEFFAKQNSLFAAFLPGIPAFHYPIWDGK